MKKIIEKLSKLVPRTQVASVYLPRDISLVLRPIKADVACKVAIFYSFQFMSQHFDSLGPLLQ